MKTMILLFRSIVEYILSLSLAAESKLVNDQVVREANTIQSMWSLLSAAKHYRNTPNDRRIWRVRSPLDLKQKKPMFSSLTKAYSWHFRCWHASSRVLTRYQVDSKEVKGKCAFFLFTVVSLPQYVTWRSAGWTTERVDLWWCIEHSILWNPIQLQHMPLCASKLPDMWKCNVKSESGYSQNTLLSNVLVSFCGMS